MDVQITLILAAYVVNSGLTIAPHHNHGDQFQNLFDSITKNDAKKNGFYREILKQEVGKQRHIFDDMKEELRTARHQNMIASRKAYQIVAKRGTNESQSANETEYKDYGVEVSAETVRKCDPKVQQCLKVYKKVNTKLKDENTQLQNKNKQLKKEKEYLHFQCAMNVMQRSVKFLYEEVIQQFEEIKKFDPSDGAGNVHPIISRLAPPPQLSAPQREYLVYKEFFRILPNYTRTPEFCRKPERFPPHFEVAEYLDSHLLTERLRTEFCATVPSVYYMCRYYSSLNESEGIRRFEKDHSVPSLPVALSTHGWWSFNEVDQAYMNILQCAVNGSKIDSLKVKEGLLYKDIILPVLNPYEGC